MEHEKLVNAHEQANNIQQTLKAMIKERVRRLQSLTTAERSKKHNLG